MLPILRTSWPGLLDEFLNHESLKNILDSTVYQGAAVNIMESKDDFRIEVVVPGLEKTDLKINLERHVLTISSDHNEAKHAENEVKYLRKEFSLPSFSRSFTLPDTADTDNIVAEHQQGILVLTIPKKEEAKVKPARQILVG